MRFHASPWPLVAAFALLAGCKPSDGPTASAAALPVTAHADAGGEERRPPPKPVSVGGLPDFSPLVERYGDAVVNVEVTASVRRDTADGMSDDDPLRDFFRRFGMPGPGGRSRGEAPIMHGTGSGFIVSKDGYILTNAHVVSEADEVTVRLTDRREFAAKVIGSDARTDVAVIKIDANADLPVVEIGDPSQLKTGQWVLAIGSPGQVSTAPARGRRCYAPGAWCADASLRRP